MESKQNSTQNAARIVRKSFFLGFEPDPLLTVSEWADRHRVLSQTSSAEPGRWKTERTPYLKEIMDELSPSSKASEIVFMKGAQIGGALSLDTPLPTPDGWTTMGEIKIGDKIFDDKGLPCTVVGKSKIFENNQCYQITFSDGSKIVCDHIHRWTVWDEKKYETRKQKIVSTPEIHKNFKHRLVRNRYSIPVARPILCESKQLPIDPYLLGVWLGDGNRHTGFLYLNSDDSSEILSKIDREKRIRNALGKCHEVKLKNFCRDLRLSGFLKNKVIPQNYLRSSYEQRLSLLHGLMDTDGSITDKGRCELTNVDRAIIDGTCELLSSLGVKFSVYNSMSMNSCRRKRQSPPRPLWRISFTTFDIVPFSLKRKVAKLHKSGRISETQKRRIIDVKEIDQVKTACIEVDSPSHLYLCGKTMIPTHNSECGNNWVAYCIDYVPGPMMCIQPTVELAQRYSKLRIGPLIQESQRLSEKVKDKKSRDSGNTMLQKDFPGGTLVLTGANSAAGLRSIPIKYLFRDEIDAYPIDVDGEGDPLTLSKARTNTFARRKIFDVSTPTFEGVSRIEARYESSDKRKYYVPCPKCHEKQTLKWSNVKWPDDETHKVVYVCDLCGHEIQEYHKTWMLKNGEWRKENPDCKTGIVGFHLSALYSPVGWYSWHECADDFLKAKDKPESLRSFINTVLGETWKDKGDAPEWEALYRRRENYNIGEIPMEGLFLTAGVDVQKDRLEIEIVAWGRRKENWSIDHRVFMGDTSSSENSVWLELADYIERDFVHAGGVCVKIQRLAIDTGFNTQEVYSWCRTRSQSFVMPIKGQDNQSVPISMPKSVDIKKSGKKVRRGIKIWNIGVGVLKSQLYGHLRLQPPLNEGEEFPAGFCHFPQYGEDYFKQLTAEEMLIRKNKRGFATYSWQKIRDRNEALDLRIYATAAAISVGIDRFQETDWLKFEKELGIVRKEKAVKPHENEKKSHKNIIKRRKSSFWG